MHSFKRFLRPKTYDLSPYKLVEKRNTLRSLRSYKAIGFDMDHCLVRNKTKETYPLLCNCLYNFLTEQRGYPKNLYNFDIRDRNFFMNGLVLDLNNGNILKLGEHKMVVRAYFGFERLSQESIEAVYGEPPIFKKFDEDILLTDEYYCCLTYFECYFPLVFAKMTELIRGKRSYLLKSEVMDLLADAAAAVEVNYNHFNKDIYLPITDFGDYYRTIIEDKDKYLFKQDRMIASLKALQDQGKVIFLITDSHYEFADELMKYSYGERWREFFDFIIVNGRKKRFFLPNDHLFREIVISEQNRMGRETLIMEKYKMYTDGNVRALEKNIDRIAKDTEGRILYVGDNFSHDILTCKRLPNWDGVCVMEELYGLDIGEGYDGRIWGNWKYDETPYGRIPTFWYSEMMKKADKCVPRVDSEEMVRFYLGEQELVDLEERQEENLTYRFL